MKELKRLTTDLVLMSETDAGWSVIPVGDDLIKTLKNSFPEENIDFACVEERNPWEFLERLASPQDWWDEFMQEQGVKYAELLEYIRENFNNVRLLRFGKIKILVVLLLEKKEDSSKIALVSWVVET
ncbi:MAG: nuclease A inhibitor family protein [Cytophagales bacterium]|nr:nuclease A inhibitor family protein [Cytophagales bacterium]MDW8383446.1 nuclease A inhibitor family protein [Flammeovirgaceae bacterium]